MLTIMRQIQEMMIQSKAEKPKFRRKAFKRLGKQLGKRFPYYDIFELDDMTYLVDFGRNRKYLICDKDLESYYWRYAESGPGVAFAFIKLRVINEFCNLMNRR